MYRSTILQRRNARRTILGLTAMLYLTGLLGSALHLATASHHHHPSAGNPADGKTQTNRSTLGLFADAQLVAGDRHLCCQHGHDAHPTILPQQGPDLVSKTATRTLPACIGHEIAPRPALTGRNEAPDLLPPVLAGLTSVAAGRAPPCCLPV